MPGKAHLTLPDSILEGTPEEVAWRTLRRPPKITDWRTTDTTASCTSSPCNAMLTPTCPTLTSTQRGANWSATPTPNDGRNHAHFTAPNRPITAPSFDLAHSFPCDLRVGILAICGYQIWRCFQLGRAPCDPSVLRFAMLNFAICGYVSLRSAVTTTCTSPP